MIPPWLPPHTRGCPRQSRLFCPTRVLTELVSKMRDMRMDKTELGCLRAIILFNPGGPIFVSIPTAALRSVAAPPGTSPLRLTLFSPPLLPPPDAKGLSNPGEVELLREKVYASLESYCKQKYPDQQGRYGGGGGGCQSPLGFRGEGRGCPPTSA